MNGRKREKVYFKDLFNMDTQEQIAVHICDCDGVQRANYFRGELIRRNEIETRVRKRKNGKTAKNYEVNQEMIKFGGDMVMDWIWGLCNMDCRSGGVPEDWRFAVIVPLYKGKGARSRCRYY